MMKKVLGFVCFMVVVSCIFWVADKADQYTTQAICYNVENGIATFTTESGNDYEWELEEEDSFVIGGTYKLTMKDYEDCNPLNDSIVKIN